MLSGKRGMVLLEYHGGNDGRMTFYGPATRTRYTFGRSRPQGYVDEADAPGMLALEEHRQRLFRKVPVTRPLHIGWLVPTTGCFGAVREMVECSNVLVRHKNRVTIYSPDAEPIKWLPSLAAHGDLAALQADRLDVLLGILDWQPSLYDELLANEAKVKGVCVMGVEPKPAVIATLRGKEVEGPDPALLMLRDAIERGLMILPDSEYQCRWLERKVGVQAGPSIGGINLRMFRPLKPERISPPYRVIYSGDPRPRKGLDTVTAALAMLAESGAEIEADCYWGRRFDQEQLVRFIGDADVFVDGHRRGGWCNPVIEAMACGTAVVCTRVGATADFAVDGETALVVPPDSPRAMAQAIARLLEDEDLRARIAEGGRAYAARFDYEIVGARLEAALRERLDA